MKILDYYVHQGHQREFFKLNHDFYLIGVNGSRPKWNENHRPLNNNVKLLAENNITNLDFDVVILRSPIPYEKYKPFIARGAVPVAVVQTTSIFKIPKECKHVIWNSLDVMNKYRSVLKNKNHYYIVHGYDPDEFSDLGLSRNGRVLTVANVFKGRSEIMGYPLWKSLYSKIKKMDVVGHGNLDMYRHNREAKTFSELIKIYNSYSVYFNPTAQSAMPRSRAEAMMCGTPIVSTNNFDISRYIKNGHDGYISNNQRDLEATINNLLSNPEKAREIGMNGRESAINHFHIKDFLSKWEQVLGSL